jgi:hypothetical protein
MAETIFRAWAAEDPAGASLAVATVESQPIRANAVSGVVTGWLDADGDSAAIVRWIDGIPRGFARDIANAEIVAAMSLEQPYQAWERAREIENPYAAERGDGNSFQRHPGFRSWHGTAGFGCGPAPAERGFRFSTTGRRRRGDAQMRRSVRAWQCLRLSISVASVSVFDPLGFAAEPGGTLPPGALPPLVAQALKKGWAAMDIVSVRKEERNDYVHFHVLLREKTGERKIEVLENGSVVKTEPLAPPKR